MLKTRHIFSYAIPGLAFSSLMAPVAVLLPALYSKYTGITLATIGTLFVVMRIFDAVTDPLIGFLSDNTRTPIGARKPWVIGGGLLTMLAVFFLFQIPSGATALYFGLWGLLYYLGSTMYQIPHLAWGRELTTDYSLRAKVFGIRSFLETSGSFIYSGLPFILILLAITEETNFSRETMRALAIIVLILIPVSVLLAVIYGPTTQATGKQSPHLRLAIRAAAGNRPLLRFLTAHIVSGIGTGFVAALFFPFIDRYLNLGSYAPHIFIGANLATILSLPFWVRIASKIGKHRAWAISGVINFIACLPLIFVTPGPAALPVAIGCFIIYGISNAAPAVAATALLGDIVDYDTLKNRVDRSGSFYALLFLAAKMAAGAGGVSLILLGAVFGFEMAPGAPIEGSAQHGIILLFCIVPGLLHLALVPLLWNFPINKTTYNVIRRRLQQRQDRQISKNEEAMLEPKAATCEQPL